MCTALTFTEKDTYFGRNLDYMHTFGEKVVITPRNYKFIFRNKEEISSHYAITGTAVVNNDYPLYFDATNEKGLSIAGLNFPDNACYFENMHGKVNIASFELIPWILCKCENISDVRKKLIEINITNEAFSREIPPAPLHWIISDKSGSLTVEQTQSGLRIYANSVGVLTNNPTFDIQMFNLSNYLSLSKEQPENSFSDKIELKPYSFGMGGMGLPGDMSSMSRFVKACFLKLNSVCGDSEEERVNQFFHILSSVGQLRGCVKTDTGFEITNYSSCCNAAKGIYYFTTYDNRTIRAVDMHHENLEGGKLITYEIYKKQKFEFLN